MVRVSQINSYIINDVLMSLWNVSVRMRATRIISAAMAHVTHHLQRIIVIVCFCQIRRWIYLRTHSARAVDFTCLAYGEVASLQPNHKSDTKKLVVVFMPSGRITFVFFSNCADKSTECIRMNKRNGSLSIDICGMRFASMAKLLFEELENLTRSQTHIFYLNWWWLLKHESHL